MRFAYDLHIHSGLSPCSDEDMSPNNIMNMAILKGLDIIAVTDHNHSGNLRAFLKLAEKRDMLVIPGMEVETAEEVHVVCLLPDADTAEQLAASVYERLPDRLNREDIFGKQCLFDDQDELLGCEQRMLIQASKISFDELWDQVAALGGVFIPAHVDRDSYSVLSNLGMMPDYLPVCTVEISSGCQTELLLKKYPEMHQYRLIRSSDAHHLWDISERDNFMELPERSIEAVFRYLKEKS